MPDCLFCKIAAGEIPSTELYSDEAVYAFADIAPQAPTHVLVIPREHIASAAEIDGDNSAAAARCLEVIAKLAKTLGLSSGFRVISNAGDAAGQTVKHLHFHVLAGKDMSDRLL
jgi:histidine triad (HIT) family protein